ncbi:hypothetical protein C1H46_024195 [Malus baccata]|uniref:Uncharacterized protein n=1 Tax=Malus baccata TaxID=106549 RepID=A0A540LV53_MALBA|nr:hypothetical protein C1H46_024195 [Malus baccata]
MGAVVVGKLGQKLEDAIDDLEIELSYTFQRSCNNRMGMKSSAEIDLLLLKKKR